MKNFLRLAGVLLCLTVAKFPATAVVSACGPDTCAEDNPAYCYNVILPTSCPPPCVYDFFGGRCIYDGNGCYEYTVCDYNCYC